MIKTNKRLVGLFITLSMLAALLTGLTGCDKNTVAPDVPNVDTVTEKAADTTEPAKLGKGDLPVVPVQLMTREANMWEGFYNSPTIEIDGNGTYSAALTVPGSYTVFPMLIISAENVNTTDQILAGAKELPAEYLNAVVTVDKATVNGGNVELVLVNNKDIDITPDSGPVHGYFNVQIWNAWWEPSQRIDVGATSGLSFSANPEKGLEFNEPVRTFEIEFTVSGVLAKGEEPKPKETAATSDEEIQTAPPIERNPANITGDFDITPTAEDIVRSIGVGWNLGNTLDAYFSDNPSAQIPWVDYDNMDEVETGWLNGVANLTTPELFARVKAAGFGGVRIPVTWYKMATGAPDYKIREDWMERVQSIVDMAVDEGLYVILNTHHDEYIMRFDEDPAVGERAVTALWTQIAERFKEYDEKLIFEGLNEPRRRTNAWDKPSNSWDWTGDSQAYIALNRWNQAFVNAVRKSGGNNEFRHLMLATYGAQSYDGPLNGFELPTDPVSGNGKSRFILSVHVYAPHNWAHNGHGSYSGADSIKRDIDRVAKRATALGIPVILGEWGTLARLDHNDRATHAYDYIKTVSQSSVAMSTFWWDDHGSFSLISRTNPISDKSKEIIDAIMRAYSEYSS